MEFPLSFCSNNLPGAWGHCCVEKEKKKKSHDNLRTCEMHEGQLCIRHFDALGRLSLNSSLLWLAAGIYFTTLIISNCKSQAAILLGYELEGYLYYGDNTRRCLSLSEKVN